MEYLTSLALNSYMYKSSDHINRYSHGEGKHIVYHAFYLQPIAHERFKKRNFDELNKYCFIATQS